MLDHKTLEYNQFLSLSKLYLGSQVEYDKVDDLNDAYRELKNHMRNAGNLDSRLNKPNYMKPLKTKYRSFNTRATSTPIDAIFNPNLSAFNADKKMHDIRNIVENMTMKMTQGGRNP